MKIIYKDWTNSIHSEGKKKNKQNVTFLCTHSNE